MGRSKRNEPKRGRKSAQPNERQRCALAGIVPRAVVADDRGAVGVVLEVSDDGEIAVAFTRGRLRTCTLADRLEVLAGPREGHAGRLVVLEQWLQRPDDWPLGHDEASKAFELEAWAMIVDLAERRGFVLGEDLEVSFTARRPWVRVPKILKLSHAEAWAHLTQPLQVRGEGEGSEQPVVEDGRRGRVCLKLETEGGGPAWLYRDGERERLFEGRWVGREEAGAYAREHGHELKVE